MQRRCPRARFHCLASLSDHILDFTRESPSRRCGVADVVGHDGGMVYGVVYQVSDQDIALLDRLEGFAPGVDAYRRTEREVTTLKPPIGTLRVELYEVARKVPFVAPSRQYLELLVDGADYWGLPATYIEQLRAFAVRD